MDITATGHWVIELGKGKGAYSVRLRTVSFNRAMAVYDGYHCHSGGKKRMRFQYPDGTGYVAYRTLSDKNTYTEYTHPDYR